MVEEPELEAQVFLSSFFLGLYLCVCRFFQATFDVKNSLVGVVELDLKLGFFFFHFFVDVVQLLLAPIIVQRFKNNPSLSFRFFFSFFCLHCWALQEDLELKLKSQMGLELELWWFFFFWFSCFPWFCRSFFFHLPSKSYSSQFVL